LEILLKNWLSIKMEDGFAKSAARRHRLHARECSPLEMKKTAACFQAAVLRFKD